MDCFTVQPTMKKKDDCMQDAVLSEAEGSETDSESGQAAADASAGFLQGFLLLLRLWF